LDGTNILVLKEHDVKVITDLMMGGDGTNTEGELGELHLSAMESALWYHSPAVRAFSLSLHQC